MMLRISALAIALVTAAGLYKKAWLPAKKCIRAGFFVYYTHLSNLLVLAYQLALGIAGHDPSCGVFRWLSAQVTALSVTLCIYVTHLLYAFVLIPAAKRSGDADWLRGRYSFANLCVHYVTPGLTVLQWLLWQDKTGLTLRHAACCLRDAAGADGTAHRLQPKAISLPVSGLSAAGGEALLAVRFRHPDVFLPAGLRVRVAGTPTVKTEKEDAWGIPCVLFFCAYDRLNSPRGDPRTAPADARRRSSPDPRRTAPRFYPGCSPDSSGRRCGA